MACADKTTPGIMRARYLIQRRPAIIFRQGGVGAKRVIELKDADSLGEVTT